MKTLSIHFRIFLCLLALLLPMGIGAQTISPADRSTTDSAIMAGARIGFVDIELTLDGSEAVRTIVGEIDEELAVMDRAIQDKRRQLRKLRVDLDQKAAVMREEERKARQQEAVDLLQELEEMDYRFQRSVRQKQQTTIEPLLEEVIKVIGEVGRRDGYDLIVRGEVVLWGHKTVDLTPVVVKELDNRTDALREAVKNKRPKGTEVSAEGPVERDPAAESYRQPERLPLIP